MMDARKLEKATRGRLNRETKDHTTAPGDTASGSSRASQKHDAAASSWGRPISLDDQELVPLDTSTSSSSNCSSPMEVLRNKYVSFHANQGGGGAVKTGDLEAVNHGEEGRDGRQKRDFSTRDQQHPEANGDDLSSYDEDYEPQVLPPLLRGKAKKGSDGYGASMKPGGQLLRARALEARHARWKQHQHEAEEEKREKKEVREAVVCKNGCNEYAGKQPCDLQQKSPTVFCGRHHHPPPPFLLYPSRSDARRHLDA